MVGGDSPGVIILLLLPVLEVGIVLVRTLVWICFWGGREFGVEVVELDGQKNMTGKCWGYWALVDRIFDLSACYVKR